MAFDIGLTFNKAVKAFLYFGVPAALTNWEAAQGFSVFLVVGTALTALADWLKHRDVVK